MSEIQLMHYKQKTPEETVQFLQDILKNMKVEVTETWQERSSIGTYALRLDFRGTKIGANGKGVSKAYAKASAYAEFFERYQNDILGPRVFFGSKFPFLMSPDEKILSSGDIKTLIHLLLYIFLRGDLVEFLMRRKRKRFMMSKRLIIIFMD